MSIADDMTQDPFIKMLDMYEMLNKIKELALKHPNDFKLGKEVRKLTWEQK